MVLNDGNVTRVRGRREMLLLRRSAAMDGSGWRFTAMQGRGDDGSAKRERYREDAFCFVTFLFNK